MFFTKHQISISELFLKDHVTLKAGVTMLKNLPNKYNFLNILKSKSFILNCKKKNWNMTVFTLFFYHIKAALVSTEDLKIIFDPKQLCIIMVGSNNDLFSWCIFV